jgi:hypothetical protein
MRSKSFTDSTTIYKSMASARTGPYLCARKASDSQRFTRPNRLMMGATPSSAVQQTAYDNLRSCLLDANEERLKDAEGNPKTLRHRFVIYCDDIAAGADTLEELYELLEALICCCYRAGIQIKAGKLKFGAPKVIFHNYTISKKGTEPKEANLCSFANIREPNDMYQLRAFLGCLSTTQPVYQRLWHNSQTTSQHNQKGCQRHNPMDQRHRLRSGLPQTQSVNH